MKRFYPTGRVLITCILLLGAFSLPQQLFGQAVDKPVSTAQTAGDSVMLNWLKSLYDEGVSISADSITINPETSRLLTDEAYRKLMYPKEYQWEAARYFIQRHDLKKAFWYFLNLYLVNQQNKEVVIKSLLIYDRIFKMDKILVNVFYTYIFTDPEIGTIAESQSKITAPHIMEKKLDALNEILGYLSRYRTTGPPDQNGVKKN